MSFKEESKRCSVCGEPVHYLTDDCVSDGCDYSHIGCNYPDFKLVQKQVRRGYKTKFICKREDGDEWECETCKQKCEYDACDECHHPLSEMGQTYYEKTIYDKSIDNIKEVKRVCYECASEYFDDSYGDPVEFTIYYPKPLEVVKKREG